MIVILPGTFKVSANDADYKYVQRGRLHSINKRSIMISHYILQDD